MSVRTRTVSSWVALAVVLALWGLARGLGGRVSDRAGASSAAGPQPLVPDLNRAPPAHLVLLPGIGPARARAIADERAQGGPFRTLADLRRVHGIGPATVADLEGLVRLGPPPAAGVPSAAAGCPAGAMPALVREGDP